MRVSFRKSFTRDLKKVKDREVLDRVREVIAHVEAAATLLEIAEIKKISGAAQYYRFRTSSARR